MPRSIWSQGATQYMKPLYSSPASNKAFVRKFKKRKRKEYVSGKFFTKVGQYENFPVLEFWNKHSGKPVMAMGRWKLEMVLSKLDEIKEFIALPAARRTSQ